MFSTATRIKNWIIPLALVALTFVVYLPVLWSDFVEIDDWSYVYKNIHINSGLKFNNVLWGWTHILGGNWHPLTAMSHMLDCQLFGANPLWHHAENVLIHCANVGLLFFLVCRFEKGFDATIPAWIIAAIFAVHPLHVESVAWISERKDVLSAFFFLLSLHAYFTFAAENKKRAYYLCLVWFALGLLSKPMLVTLPCVLLLLDFWPLRRSNWKALAIEKWPFFALSLADSIVTMFTQTKAGAMMDQVPWPSKPGFILKGYWFYFEKMFAPTNLAMFYPPDTRPSTALLVMVLCGLIGLTVLAVLLRRRVPAALVGWLWFLGMLVPVVGFVHSGSQAYADRYSYLPSIGLSLALIWPITLIIATRQRAALVIVGVATCALVALVNVAQSQVLFWQNTEVLYSRAITAVPNNRDALVHYGGHYEDIGLLDKAISYYVKALTIQEEGFSLFHLGRIYLRKHNLDAAQKCFERALLNAPDRPEVNRALGRLCDERNESQKALDYFHRAAVASPDYVDALRDFAWIVASDKTISATNAPQAIEFAKRAARLEPENAVNVAILAAAQARAGRFSDAVQTEQRAISIAQATD
ncbi:MAG: tetratricopeptide repeat protein, partial [Limisphaerales bacterium]